MNAFKKEFAAKLLDVDQSDMAYEQIVSDMDEVLSNRTRQERYSDSYSGWYLFLSELSSSFVYKLMNRCLSDDQQPDQVDEDLMRLIVCLDMASGASNWEMILGNVSDGFEDRFMKIKSSLMVAA